MTYTLTQLGYLAQVPRFDKYQLAPPAMSLGYSALANLGIRHVAKPHLFRLAQETGGVVINGISDDSYYAQFFYSRAIGARMSFSGDLFANYYDSGLAPGILSLGGTGSLSRSFGRLGTTASVGVYTFNQDGQQDQTQAQATLGARYHF